MFSRASALAALVTLVALIFPAPAAGATPGWTESSLGPAALSDIDFYGPDAGLAVGWEGNIWRTADGGTSWQRADAGIEARLRKVSLADPHTAYALGDNVLLKSVDAGHTWNALPLPAIEELQGFRTMDFRDASVGLVLATVTKPPTDPPSPPEPDSLILSTTNGGATWNVIGPGLGWLDDIIFATSNVAYAAGWGRLLRSEDQGRSWKPVPAAVLDDEGMPLPQTPSGAFPSHLAFVNEDTGYAIGGAILKTTDGGATWRTLPVASIAGIADIDFADPTTGLAVGTHVLRTIDGGASWKEMAHPGQGWLAAVHMVDANKAYVAGFSPGQGTPPGGGIYRSKDGGATWEIQFEGAGALYAIQAIDTSTVRIAGVLGGSRPAVFGTDDGGHTWKSSVVIDGGATRMGALTFLTPQVGFVSVYQPTNVAYGFAAHLRTTTDSGQSWNDVPLPVDGFVSDIAFADETTGYATSEGGSILFTHDTGRSWTLLGSFADIGWRAVAAPSANVIYAVGPSSRYFNAPAETAYNLAWSTNGGQTWNKRLLGTTLAELLDVDFATPLIGWAVGQDEGHAVLFKTTDGGQSWTKYSFEGTHWPWTVSAVTPDVAYFAAVGGDWRCQVLRTLDGGQEWTFEDIGDCHYEFFADFANQSVGLAALSPGRVSVNGHADLGGTGIVPTVEVIGPVSTSPKSPELELPPVGDGPGAAQVVPGAIGPSTGDHVPATESRLTGWVWALGLLGVVALSAGAITSFRWRAQRR